VQPVPGEAGRVAVTEDAVTRYQTPQVAVKDVAFETSFVGDDAALTTGA
jgi:hypothetical protein